MGGPSPAPSHEVQGGWNLVVLVCYTRAWWVLSRDVSDLIYELAKVLLGHFSAFHSEAGKLRALRRCCIDWVGPSSGGGVLGLALLTFGAFKSSSMPGPASLRRDNQKHLQTWCQSGTLLPGFTSQVTMDKLLFSRSVVSADCSTPGFPVLHHLQGFAQTPVHRVGDAIPPSHPLSPPWTSSSSVNGEAGKNYPAVWVCGLNELVWKSRGLSGQWYQY